MRLVLVSFCVSPVTSDVEIFSGAHRPSRGFLFGPSGSVICPFFKNWVICLVIEVFVLDTSPLSDTCVMNIFSQSRSVSNSIFPRADAFDFGEVQCLLVQPVSSASPCYSQCVPSCSAVFADPRSRGCPRVPGKALASDPESIWN